MRILYTIFLLALLAVSCRVHRINKITDAYVERYPTDNPIIDSTVYQHHWNIDSLKNILHNARGVLSFGYLPKGSTILTVKYKNGKTKQILFIGGRPLRFHFTEGLGRNIWYVVKKTK